MSKRIEAHLARLKGRGYDWPIPWEAVADIGRSEDCRFVAYRCPAGVLTIGWGETQDVTADMRWTADQADARFFQQVTRYARKVEAMLDVPANENQLGALVSLAYNIGLGDPKDTKRKRGFYWSTVRRKHNAGDIEAAARAFALFNKARVNGQLTVLRGLTTRRAAEAAMYLQPIDDAPGERMPQAVEPESSLSASPIARGGATTAGVGGLAALTTISDQAKGVADKVAEFVGLPPAALAAAVLVIAGLGVMHWRAKQRGDGWA
jgi:GH24 family phage-related lysozyme (muramidase)